MEQYNQTGVDNLVLLGSLQDYSKAEDMYLDIAAGWLLWLANPAREKELGFSPLNVPLLGPALMKLRLAGSLNSFDFARKQGEGLADFGWADDERKQFRDSIRSSLDFVLERSLFRISELKQLSCDDVSDVYNVWSVVDKLSHRVTQVNGGPNVHNIEIPSLPPWLGLGEDPHNYYPFHPSVILQLLWRVY
jgi:hypothetical protein